MNALRDIVQTLAGLAAFVLVVAVLVVTGPVLLAVLGVLLAIAIPS